MLEYWAASDIASKVFADLGIDDDIYLTWNKSDVQAFEKQYMQDDFIRPLVETELATRDTSENSPAEIEDITEGAVDEVFYMLQNIVDKYYSYQNQITLTAYREIVQTLQNTAFSGVNDVDVEYDPADPDVGIFNEERRIVFTLSNGSYITFEVSIDED